MGLLEHLETARLGILAEDLSELLVTVPLEVKVVVILVVVVGVDRNGVETNGPK